MTLGVVVVIDHGQAVPARVDLTADALWRLGIVALEERDGDGDTVELWTSLGDDRAAVDQALRRAGTLPEWCTWHFVELDATVGDTWRDFAVPTWIEPDLVVVPAWLAVDDLEATDRATTVISIEPGATFGAGDHPTTVLSLRALYRHLGRHLGHHRGSVLDVGCGSGVLAIGAALLGARSADGIDISPAVTSIGAANARRNGVEAQVSVSTTPLAEVSGVYDIVVANILAPALVDLAEHLVRVTADDGILVISGVLTGRFDHVVEALAPLRVTRVDHLDGWAAVTLRR